MQTYVSLLRGVNVGGRTIRMTDLKDCYETAGFSNVSTLLQSGNVVFTSTMSDLEAIRAKLETAVGSRFDYPAKILVLGQGELKPIVDHYPFDRSNDNYQHYIIFVRPELAKKLSNSPVDPDPAVEEVAPGSDVVYWKVQRGMTLKSVFAKALTKPEFKDFHTNRNIKTVAKLLA